MSLKKNNQNKLIIGGLVTIALTLPIVPFIGANIGQEENVVAYANEVVSESGLMEGTELVRYIHRLTHPIIKSDTKYYQDVIPTKENIEKAMEGIKADYDIYFGVPLEDVVKILNEFNEGNFKNAVELHNIMWDYEDGQIGKAKSLKKKAIKEIKNKYYK